MPILSNAMTVFIDGLTPEQEDRLLAKPLWSRWNCPRNEGGDTILDVPRCMVEVALDMTQDQLVNARILADRMIDNAYQEFESHCSDYTQPTVVKAIHDRILTNRGVREMIAQSLLIPVEV